MTFSEKIEEMKSYITTSDLMRFREEIKRFKDLTGGKYQVSYIEGIDIISNLIYELSLNMSVKRSYDFQQEALSVWKERKTSIVQIARSTPDFWGEKLDMTYTEDMDRNIINLARDMMNTFSLEKPFFQISIEEGLYTPKQEVDLDQEANKRLEECGKLWNKKREQMYTDALHAVCTFLAEIEGLRDNVDIHNSRMSEIGIPGMQINYDQQKGKSLLSKVIDLTDKESLKKLDLYTKKVLLAFYSNKATKKVESFVTTFFVLGKIGGIQEALNIDDDTLRSLIVEQRYLSTIWEREIQKLKKEKYQRKIVDRKDMILYSIMNSGYELMEDSYLDSGINIEEFEGCFGDGSFQEDKDLISYYTSMLDNIYTAKEWSMETLINLVMKDAKGLNIRNWGYIPERYAKGLNSIEAGRRYILVGIDFPRYNMPVRLHLDRERLVNLVKIGLGSNKIPVYRGHEDFERVKLDGRRRRMGTQILMPIQKEQRKALEEAVNTQTDNPNYKLIAHLNWLAYPNRVPEHLKNQSEREVDLETGVISLSGIDVGENPGGNSNADGR